MQRPPCRNSSSGHFYIPTSRLWRDRFALQLGTTWLRSWPHRLTGLGIVPSGVKVLICSVARIRAHGPHFKERK